MHERELDKEHSLVTYSLPADAEKCVVNGNVSIAHSPNPHVGDIYHIYGPVTYLHQKGKGGDVTSTPCVLDVAADKVDLQNHEDTNNSSKVCIVGEQKFKIRKLHILVAACLILVATAATLSTIFILRDRASAGGGDNDDVGPVVVVKRAEWNAENSTGPISKLNILPPPYVIIAHTVSQECNTTDACKSLVRSIQAYHISLGYGDIGYNFLVGGDGKAYEGLGWDMHGAHTIPFNSRSIGLAFIGNFENKEPPRKQINIALLLLEEGVRIKKLAPNYKVFGHKQVVATLSPGAKLMDIIETTWPHWAPYDPNKDD